MMNDNNFLTLAFLYSQKSLAQTMADLNYSLTQSHQNLMLQQQLQRSTTHIPYPYPITNNQFSCECVQETVYADNEAASIICHNLQSAIQTTCCGSVQNVVRPKEETSTVIIKEPVDLRTMTKIGNRCKGFADERRFNKFWTFIFNKIAIFLAVWRYEQKKNKKEVMYCISF